MAITKKDRIRAKRRGNRVTHRVKRIALLPRISVFRSLKNIYAQVIDDTAHKTLANFSSLQLTEKISDKKAIARNVGLELAKRSLENGIEKVVFDRNKFAYHGRVKALADGLREGGLKF